MEPTEANKERWEFIRKVFIVVLFHQSIYGIKWYRPVAQLTDEEAVKYISSDILDIFEIFLNADSNSYTLLSLSEEIIEKYKQEIQKIKFWIRLINNIF